jgi:hypothetical protein
MENEKQSATAERSNMQKYKLIVTGTVIHVGSLVEQTFNKRGSSMQAKHTNQSRRWCKPGGNARHAGTQLGVTRQYRGRNTNSARKSTEYESGR